MKKDNTVLKKILKLAEEEKTTLKHPYVGSEHLLLVILKNNNDVSNYLKEYNVSYNSFKNELVNIVGSSTKDCSFNLYTPLLRKIVNKYKGKKVDEDEIYNDLFFSLLDEGEGIAIRILLRMDVDLDVIYSSMKEKNKLRDMVEATKVGVILNNVVNNKETISGRDKEIDKLILCLSRKKKCNPLLIGDAGVGKTALVEELARRINKGMVPNSLKDYKIISIEMGSLISGTKYRGEFEDRLNKIIKELIYNKKVIVFIDEIHTMVGAGGAEGAINASDILKPYLARGELKCIGATTGSEYTNSIHKDKALLRRFDIININEPNKKDMYTLLKQVKKEYEMFHSVKVPNKLLSKIIDLSELYLKRVVNPDKSIDLLDSSCSYAKMNNHNILSLDDIINTIYYKTNNCLLNKKAFANKLSLTLDKYYNKDDINKILKVFNNHKLNNPLSFFTDSNNIIDIITNELNDINRVVIDLNSYSYNSYFTLYKDKLVSESVFESLVQNPFSLVIFKNINFENKLIVDEITDILKNGMAVLKNNDKIYFNNAIIILYEELKDEYKTGFNKSFKTTKIPSKLMRYVNADLRNITMKKINS